MFMKRDQDSITEPTMADILYNPPELTSYGSGWEIINVESYHLQYFDRK